MSEETDDKERARELWLRKKAGNRKGFKPRKSARKTFNEDMLDCSVQDGLPITLDYRCGGEREILTGKLSKEKSYYFVEGKKYAIFSADNVLRFLSHFPNPDNIPMTIVVRKWE